MGTSPRGEMFPGTQVGLLRNTCSRSLVSGVGDQRFLGPAIWHYLVGRSIEGSQGPGPLSSSGCPSLCEH